MKPTLAARLRRATDSFWGACLGAGVYAAWAVWANWDAGERMAYTADQSDPRPASERGAEALERYIESLAS